MQSATMPAVSLFLAAFCIGSGSAVMSDPILTVIAQIKTFKDQAVEEMHLEAAEWVRFQQWCTETVTFHTKDVAKHTKTIATQKSKKKSDTLKMDAASEKYNKSVDEVARLEGIAAAEQAERNSDNGLFTESHASLDNARQGVSDAILAITNTSLLQERSSPLDANGDHDAHVKKYTSKSGGITEMLKNLEMEFEDKVTAAVAGEQNSLNGYLMAKNARDNALTAARAARDAQQTERDQAAQRLNDDIIPALEQAEVDLSGSQASLKETKTTCATKTTENAARTKTREGEIAAIDGAIALLSKATGLRTAPPSNPKATALGEAPTFLQISGATKPQMKAVSLIRQAGAKAHSKALERLAQEVESHMNGPFENLNNMIQKMIWRLKKEQREENEHKEWCDTEIAKTDKKIGVQEAKRDDLTDKIQFENGKVTLLKQEIGQLKDDISDLISQIKEETEIRKIGKKENALATADAIKGEDAVAKAISVLTAFYRESGALATPILESMVQVGDDQAPNQDGATPAPQAAAATSQITGSSGSGETALISILQEVAGGFALVRTQTKTQEDTDQEEYVTNMNTYKIDQAKKEKDVKMQEAEQKRRTEKIHALTKTLKENKIALLESNKYKADLQPACVDGDSTFAERTAARKQESDALKEAKTTLADAAKSATAGTKAFGGKFIQTPSFLQKQ